MIRRTLQLSSALVMGILASCASLESETSLPGKEVLSAAEIRVAKSTPDFEKHIRPILQTKCVSCHTYEAQPHRMSLADGSAAKKTGAIGAMIVPGKPEVSPLLMRLDGKHAGLQAMPPVGERLTKNELKILTQWVKLGAKWPMGVAGKVEL